MKTTLKEIRSATTTEELLDALDNDKIWTAGLEKLPVDLMKEFTEACVKMTKAFPCLEGKFRLINKRMGPRVYGASGFDGTVYLNVPRMRKKDVNVREDYLEQVELGQFPKGTTIQGVVVHELGHVIESLLVKGSQKTIEAQYRAWNKGTCAAEVISTALFDLDPFWSSRPKDCHRKIEAISNYAAKNPSETLAEAVNDWVANRSKAKPLSVAIVKVLQEVLPRVLGE